ncbi:MAG TPA: class I SAM-dependent methyltransferase [Chthoniobacterales bacterium]|jgi:ubiquinone/menaquinone biosynthesis C-methylase UbiE
MNSLVDPLHDRLIFRRRVRVLAQALAELVPPGANVLDVGCGDGQISARIMAQSNNVSISGIDILLRPQCHIPVREFDGVRIPYDDSVFDAVMLVDVLHHTNDPAQLLREALRVANNYILIKDHFRKGFLAGETLRLMDWVGNASKNVVLPYNYLTKSQWNEIYRNLKVTPVRTVSNLPLYSFPLSLFFGRDLHFVTLLKKQVSHKTDL